MSANCLAPSRRAARVSDRGIVVAEIIPNAHLNPQTEHAYGAATTLVFLMGSTI